MRRNGIERAQQNRRAFARERRINPGLHGFERIEHFHRRRYDGVVLLALVVEVRLLQRVVEFKSRRFQFRRKRTCIDGPCCCDFCRAISTVRPDAPQEAHRAFNGVVRPHGRVFRPTDEHDVEARGVGAVLVDQVLRVDAVSFALAHLADAAVLHYGTVSECAAVDVSFFVERVLYLGRRDVVLRAFVGRLEEDVIQEHAVVGHAFERFIKLQQTHVTHRLRPEAGIEEMQHRVLDAADVLIHRHPVVVARVDHRRLAVDLCIGRGVAHVVPRRIDEGVHRVGFATRGLAALRARALQERFVFGERVAAAVRNMVLGQHDWQILLRHRHRATIVAMNDRDGRTPITLARDAPVTQAEGGFLFA